MKQHLINKEIQILLYCAGPSLSDLKAQKLKALISQGVDWQLLINTAVQHRLVNFLYKSLKTHCRNFIPENYLDKLKKTFITNSQRNFALSATLIQILELLKKKQIPALPFKGLVQAQQLYNDPEIRSFADLDILIKKQDAIKTRDLLINKGFNTDVKIPDLQLNTYLEKENFFQLTNPSGTINIDLHWEITGRYSLCPLYFEDLEPGSGQVKILDKTVPVMSFEDTFIYLCIHSTSHCWDKLEQICSVAWLINSSVIENWHDLLDKAKQLKCKRMVLAGAMLAEQLFKIDLPTPVKHNINCDKTVQSLCRNTIKKIMSSYGQIDSESLSWRFSSVHFLIRDNIVDKIRYGGRLFFEPTVREWDKFKLPSGFLFIYHILRPFRLVFESLSSILPSNNRLSASLKRYGQFLQKKQSAGHSFLKTFFLETPYRIISKIWFAFLQSINLYFFNLLINNKRLKDCHSLHKKKLGNHYYIIVIPGVLHLLEPCLRLLPDNISFFLVLNGISRAEKDIIQQKFSSFPVIELSLFPNTSLPHGRVLNLFFKHNVLNFGIIDYDLYILNKNIFKSIKIHNDDLMTGLSGLYNEKAKLNFPTTHFMFFNTELVKQIMKKYRIGAQEYTRIPNRLIKKLSSINLGYHNFLKDYLYFFDTMNLIMAMGFYSNKSSQVLSVDEKDFFHLGGNFRSSEKNYMEIVNQKIKDFSHK